MTKTWRFMAAAFAAALAFTPFGEGHAAGYPKKPITLVSPYGPGGAADIAARQISANIDIGQPVLVVNKTGAAGVTGSFFVVRSKKDGYTLLLARVGSQAGVPAFNPNIPYKWDQFTMLGLTELNPFVLVVNAKSPYKTFDEFQKAVKGGTKLSYGSAGVGTLLHIATIVMADSMGVKLANLTHVPYKGGGKARAAIVGGHVDFMWQNLSGVIGAIESKQLRALAVTTPERFAAIKDVPTVKELGHPKMEAIVGWSGIYGPPGLKKDVVDVWIAKLQGLKNNKKWVAQTEKLGSIPDVRSPEDTKAFVQKQFEAFKSALTNLGAGVQKK